MSINTYTPETYNIVHKTKVDFTKRIITDIVNVVQYDNGIVVVEVSIFNDGLPMILPNNDDISMKIRWSKNLIEYVVKDILGCNVDRNKVYFNLDSNMTREHGTYNPILELIIGSQENSRVGSSPMIFKVDKNPVNI